MVGLSVIPRNCFLDSVQELLDEPLEDKAESNSDRDSASESAEQRECHNASKGKSKHGEATTFCADCAEFYCDSCASYHTMFDITSGHQLIPAADVDNSTSEAARFMKKIPNCDVHPTLPLDIYCDSCRAPVCTKCSLLAHKYHTYRELVIVSKEARNRLTGLTQASSGHISKLNRHLKALEVSRSNIQGDAKKTREEVRQVADELREMVTKREDYLLQQIQESEKSALGEVQEAQKDTEQKKANTQSLKAYMQCLQASGAATDQVVHTPGLQEQLRRHETSPLRGITWTVTFTKDKPSAMLGSIKMDYSVAVTPGSPPFDPESPGGKSSKRDSKNLAPTLGKKFTFGKTRKGSQSKENSKED